MINKNSLYIIYTLSMLFLLSCNYSDKKDALKKTNISKDIEQKEIISIVKSFFKWYKKNYDSINSYQIIPQYDGDSIIEPYRIDKVAMEKYLNTLKSSGFISNDFLSKKRSFFINCDEQMISENQIEGVPPCWDGDIILYTHEINETLDKIEMAKFSNLVLNDSTAFIKMKTLYNLGVFLKKENNKWMITDTKGLGL